MIKQNIQTPGSRQHLPAYDTSAEAHEAIGKKRRAKLQEDILAVCVAAQRAGAADLSGQELRRLLEAQYTREQGREVRVDVSSMTAPIGRLVTAGRLLRVKATRACSITAQNIHPLRVPLAQAPCFY